ncbi:MAG: hypothetical protein OEO79_01315 [Gemmatimonadota bacterium]|nr:hypothetical protein [Gemmatimonadota bacterium]MDH3422591.1 hypothetical protein [Gemmatimonadota bacterium]
MITRRHAHKILSAGLAALVLALSVAVPLLERGEFVDQAAIESAHDPGRCGHAHDHRICSQVGANLSLVAAFFESRAAHAVVRSSRPAQPRSDILDTLLEGPPPRAPPLV